jgi:hypothetical protein
MCLYREKFAYSWHAGLCQIQLLQPQRKRNSQGDSILKVEGIQWYFIQDILSWLNLIFILLHGYICTQLFAA